MVSPLINFNEASHIFPPLLHCIFKKKKKKKGYKQFILIMDIKDCLKLKLLISIHGGMSQMHEHSSFHL